MSLPPETTCPYCPEGSQRLFSLHGLRTHIGRIHKDVQRPIVLPGVGCGGVSQQIPVGAASQLNNSEPDVDPFRKLAGLKASTPVLRHIPKGARNIAAGMLCELISKCVERNSPEDWHSLLTFAYSALRVPDKGGTGSLTTKVKSNISTLCCTFPEDPVPRHASPSLARSIENKVFGGDIKGAARILLSDDSFAPPSADTLSALQLKHPAPSRPLSFPSISDLSTPPLSVGADSVAQALGSFFNSSASGLDGLRPGHLKELCTGAAGDNGPKLLEHLASLCNYMLAGKVNQSVCPYLYGANLCALEKKDGGVRPIAIGSVFRRLAAKLACRSVREEMATYLAPHQLGFGTKLGCEAAIHATRAFAAEPGNHGCVMVKLDVRNAFNSLERDAILSEVKEQIPSLFPFLHQLYRFPSNLFYNQSPILSQVGAQQGDPLGPLVFSLSIHKAISDLRSPLNVWYLDDGIIGGKPDVVERDLRLLIPRFKELGLEINTAKCEFFPCSPSGHSLFHTFDSFIPGLKELSANSFSLLGSPIFPCAIPEALEARKQLLLVAKERLQNITPQVSLVLLRMCFAVPKIMYLLRTTPTWLYPGSVASFDDVLRQTVESTLNVSLNESQWSQASLPIRMGGLGVRRASDVGVPAFLASAHGVVDLVASILLANGAEVRIPHASDALEVWMAGNPGAIIPQPTQNQRAWDEVGSKAVFDGLFSQATGADLARLRAVAKPESGAWLQALPSPHLGTLLDSDSMRVAVALRLGCDVCQPHHCICGAMVEANGHHALSCCRCSGRFSRHHALNDLICRALVSAKIPSRLEPAGLCRADGKRPDGMTQIPWKNGKSVVWDATCVDTFASCHLGRTSREAGGAAESAAAKKRAKYVEVENRGYLFVPVAVETMGCWGAEAKCFLKEIGRRLREAGSDPRSGAFLSQRLSIAIQRGNAASVMGTFGTGMAWGGIFE